MSMTTKVVYVHEINAWVSGYVIACINKCYF